MAPGSNRIVTMQDDNMESEHERDLLQRSEMIFSSIHHEKRQEAVPVYCFTWLDLFVVLVSMSTYLADIVTDILVMLVYWKIDETSWAALTLTFLIVPAVVMQVFSTRWYLADGHKMTVTMLLTHLCMMGPMKRYINVLIHGCRARRTKRIEDYQLMYSELSDVSMLRLFECFLESAPQLVLQLYIMIRVVEGDHILTGISACFSLISLAWTIVAYNKALRAAASRRNKVSWSGMFLQTVWRVAMVAGRIIAIVLFATVFQEWTLLILGVHWLIMTAWVVAQDTDFCNSWWEERLFNTVIGFIYIFCFFNMKEGRSRFRAIFYYIVVLTENTVMILLWWPQRTEGMWYNIPALFAVWGGFILGISSMLLYYKYFHPASKQRCHCCMAWYKIGIMCQSALCCFQSHSTGALKSTPYRKSHNSSGSNAFETTESSDEELDYRDFTDLRCSYDTPTTAVGGNIQKKTSTVCNKHMLNPHHRHLFPHSSSSKQCGMAVAVVGSAQKGFKVQSFKPDQEQLVKNGTLSKVSMPRPRATSTPGDDLNLKHSRPRETGNGYIAEVSEPNDTSTETSAFDGQDCIDVAADTPRTKLAKMCPTPKTHKPGSPSTLVRKWVQKNQDMYMEGKGCFSGSFKEDVTPICRTKPEGHVTIDCSPSPAKEDPAKTRKYPLRMKSFSKKTRRRGNRKQRQNRSMRNSFREAFGFHVIDVDEVLNKNQQSKQRDWEETEILGMAAEAKPSKVKKIKQKQNCNAIKCRRDEPPIITEPTKRIKSKKILGNNQLKSTVIDEIDFPYFDDTVEENKCDDTPFVTAVQPSIYDNGGNGLKLNSDKHSKEDARTDFDEEKENLYEPGFSMDRVEYLQKFGKSALKSNSQDSPARKKLAFKPGTHLLQGNENRQKKQKMNRSVEPLGKSMDGVLDSGENYRIHISEAEVRNPSPRKALAAVENRRNIR
uniref:XK-related protein n=1 Tax=Phallusia mammillata TaxID=59560 RepID=A0A6F9DI93_9ASCI|nr:uncharacterized protein LOC104265836 [Phallusia mammillata]